MVEPWVELRVHGVSGTPPESMLDFAHVNQVAGDEFGRYFRRYDEHGLELPGYDGQVVEGYHWGKFTSGSWSQAIWLLLAPFGIINAAQFTLEPPTSRSAKVWYTAASASLRLVGLSLTVLFVLGTAVISLDLWAWQRIDLSASVRDRFIAAAALLAPVALLAMCYGLGRSRLVGDDQPEHAAPAPEADDGAEFDRPFWDRMPPTDLVRPGFLGGDAKAPALRLMHLATGLAIVGMLGFAPGRTVDGRVARFGFWVALGVLVVSTFCVVFLGDPERSASVALADRRLRRIRDSIRRQSPRVGRLLTLSGALVVAGAVVHTFAVPSARENTVIHYPGIDLIAIFTTLAAMVGMVALLITNGLLAFAERRSVARSANPRFAPFARGFAPTLLASLGVFLGVGYVGAFGVTAATALRTEERDVQAPELMSRIVYAWGITLFVLLGLAVVGSVRLRISRSELQDRVRKDFTRADGPRVPPRWISHIASAIWSARLKNSLVPVLATFAVVGWILSAATGYELLPQLQQKADLWVLPGWLTWLTQPVSAGDPATGFIMWVGTLALTGLAAALVFLGRTAIAGEAARRSVNVLWDVIAFWPRSAHPFVPPAYSQRAVRDLEKRIAWHLDRTRSTGAQTTADPGQARRLLLCAHSQGSLLSLAALLRIGTSRDAGRSERRELGLDDIGFLSFGSQLQVLFSRAFPAYVNLPTVDWLYRELGGAWRNLYRDTDYLAGPVLSWNHRGEADWFGDPRPPDLVDWSDPDGPEARQQYGADWRLLDPPIPDRLLHERPLAQLRRHSDYWTDEAWPVALAELRTTAPASTRSRITPSPSPNSLPSP